MRSDAPSRETLLALFEQAREAVEASQQHWAAVLGLTGDRRFQRQQREVLAVLAKMRKRVESARPRGEPDD